MLEHIAPGSIYSQRDTIGTEATINGVKQQDFRDYYGKWYAASNATLMVVADADPAVVEKVIREEFDGAPKRPRPTPQSPGVKAYEKSFAIVASDPEIKTESLQIVHLEPAHPPVTTVALYRADLVTSLGEMALNRRLEDKVSKGETSFLNARVGSGNDSNAVYTTEMSCRAKAGQWKAALEESALELQRARAFGFTSREIEDAKVQLSTAADRAVETESTLPAQALIGRMNRDVASGEPILSPQQEQELLRKLLPTISDEEVARDFATRFDPKAVAFIAILPAGPTVPTEAQLLEIGTKALEVKPTREVEAVRATQLMAKLPTPGTLKDLVEHKASEVWSGWLSDNVRVHYRFMDQRKNEVTVSIALIGGELLETAANRGITSAAQLAWSRPATRELSSTDIRELMTGKKVSVRGGGGGGRRGGGGGGDSISLSISGSPDDLETGFQLAHLLLTEPKIESAAFAQFQSSMREMLQESLKNPMMLGMRTASAAPFPADEPRTTPTTIEQLDKLTLEASQAWLDKLIRNSPIEMVIVGDIPKERALALAAHYIGSLPPREKVDTETFAALRRLKRPQGPVAISKTVDTETAQAYVMSGFYGTDDTNIADVRALAMAASILSTRMVKEVREEAQLVYSIGVGSRPATTYPGFGVVSAAAPTEPSKVDALVAKIGSMYDAFAATGPTADELGVTRKQIANTLEEQMREPGFWLGRMQEMTFRGTNLDDVMSAPAAYQALTAGQIQQTFAKYAGKPNRIVVVVKPEKAAAAHEQK